jgi:hypothetical protein
MHRPLSASSAETLCERLRRRIQRLIATPHAQKIQSVIVTKSDDESAEAWHLVMQEIEDTDGVRMDRLECGAIRIGWREYCEA